jgi:hypothetical protein
LRLGPVELEYGMADDNRPLNNEEHIVLAGTFDGDADRTAGRRPALRSA